MNWALILVVTSAWDGRPLDTKQVGVFDTEAKCEQALARMGGSHSFCSALPLAKGSE